jgi:uncharacterized protein YndB with AHSA1/START domain
MAAKNNIAGNSGQHSLVITRIFNAQRELVFKMWTEPEHVMEWSSPKNFTCPASKIDLRVGGKYHNCMRSPEGQNIWTTGIYREIVVPERLVMTDSFADEHGNVVPGSHYGLGPDFPLEMLVTIMFENVPGNKTKLTLIHSCLETVPAEHLAGMEQGWNEFFDKLNGNLDNRK